jgi:hypothetical protein
MKYYFSRIEVTHAEYQHYQERVHEISQTVRPSRHLDQWLRGLFQNPKKEDRGMSYDGYQFFVKVVRWQKISREHYNVLKQYL